MRAITLKGFGGYEVMSLAKNVPIPKLTGPHHVLVNVKATAVNRGDLMQRKGFYPPPPGISDILGLEACGVVSEVGPAVTNVKVGDKVMALLGGGGYAEYVDVHSGHLLPLPPHLSFTDGAAIAEVFLTAWQCLVFCMHVKEKDHVLLHAGASSVGLAAAQLCRKVLGATTITTSSEDKIAECKKYADYAVSRVPDPETKTVFESKIKKVLGDKPLINAVIDPVFGGSYLKETVNVCASDAIITIIAMMGGSTIDKFSGAACFKKRMTLQFSTLRSRDDAYKTALVSSFAERALPLFSDAVVADKRLLPIVSKVMDLESVAEAHRLVDKNAVTGKIVLKV